MAQISHKQNNMKLVSPQKMKQRLCSQLWITSLQTLDLSARVEDLQRSRGRSRANRAAGRRVIEQNINAWSF